MNINSIRYFVETAKAENLTIPWLRRKTTLLHIIMTIMQVRRPSPLQELETLQARQIWNIQLKKEI